MDCQNERPAGGAKLKKEQISKFYNYIKNTGADWVQIDLKEIEKLDWDILISRTNKFIKKYDNLYEEVIKYVWGDTSIKQPQNSLEEVEPPEPQTLT